MGSRCADHVTPLYPQKLALTSPTGGGRSVGIVRSRTKATEFFFIRAQPDDGHHDAPKHVVVASPVASYVIKLVVVLTVIHLFTL